MEYAVVTDREITAYLPKVESLAKKFAHFPEGDYDDLVQEGMISVWEALRHRNIPSQEVIKWGMFAWLRNQRRLRKGDALAGMYLSLTPEWQAEFGTVLSGLDPWSDREVRRTHPSS